MIAVIDYGVGNLQSILNKLKMLNTEAVITSDPAEINQAEKLILPGVGAFEKGMKNLKDYGLIHILNKKVIEEKTPILGICLGMQLFTKSSEEGDTAGLEWVDCTTEKFKFNPGSRLKIPHVGWNTLHFEKTHPLLKGITTESSFYFVHSYHLVCSRNEAVMTKTTYGYDFISSIQKDNILGVQFHPEKSHTSGLQILNNFVGEV